MDNGYDTARSLVHWNFKSIRDWCEAKFKMPVYRGGCTYGYRKIKYIQAISYWCTNASLKGEPLDIAGEFEDDVLDELIIESELDYIESKKAAVLTNSHTTNGRNGKNQFTTIFHCSGTQGESHMHMSSERCRTP